VSEARRHLDFAKEPLGANLCRDIRSQYFDGDGAVVAEIASKKHNRHAALAERALHNVAAAKARFEALLEVVHESQ